MERKRLKTWDYIALVLVIFAFLLQVAGYFIPTWWSYNDPSARHTIVVSMLGSVENEAEVERTKTVIEIEGGREWLFISRAFGAFGILLNFLSFIFHLLYMCIRYDCNRSASIYLLGASSLFILGGAIVFVALYKELATNLKPDLQTLGFPWGICILAGIVTIAASIVTAVATVKKANQWDFEDDDDIDFSEVQMRRR
ncbi:uncharacterized protein LOC133184311 [Saccostrea echinata]|uniref:uncharacterized protein LOC133184311 n=1 Tax=Saccostrea echinata TaxID=191078 RepID=UPI002A821A8D|nr:uncharacterized protein LOC133184311 [Saccostrea echinata]